MPDRIHEITVSGHPNHWPSAAVRGVVTFAGDAHEYSYYAKRVEEKSKDAPRGVDVGLIVPEDQLDRFGDMDFVSLQRRRRVLVEDEVVGMGAV